ncbi:ParB family protein [Serratia sp. M24T3]|uniref:ParB family protein n=1 Tax=Serratia sp. M24T3 TaxID=932213 RepID=UPI00025BBA89|nr:ParB family protein [Serratia sp. M24T3]EIC83396.1 hypothetical protein SPM24T3_17335 [Serratia sp. M24T3]
MSQPKNKRLDLNIALLQPGKTSELTSVALAPQVEIPMLLTLDELAPNPDNPRTSRNPKFDDIKSSIMARGLDTVPKVTRDPARDTNYIFSDGGNTRYQILRELWEATGDRKYFHIQCIFKPWPGRLACVIGHLAENEVRGDLSFIEKAFGIQQARNIYEEQLGKRVTLRAFSDLLAQEGYPIHYSNISRMEDTVKYLFPCMPTLLEAGMGRPQIQSLLGLRANALKTWGSFKTDANQENSFESVFEEVCRQLDDPEIYTLDQLRDDLIGALIEAIPHPALNYDRWLLELDPKEQTRRLHFGEPMPEVYVAEHAENAFPLINKTLIKGPDPSAMEETRVLSELKRDDDLHHDQSHNELELETVRHTDVPKMHSPACAVEPVLGNIDDDNSFVDDVWNIAPLQDDIEHLQVLTYRLAFDIARHAACEKDISPNKTSLYSVGFSLNIHFHHPVSALLGALAGHDSEYILDPNCLLQVLTGAEGAPDAPLLDDAQTLNFFRLIRLLRRLRELQRGLPTSDDFEEDAR